MWSRVRVTSRGWTLRVASISVSQCDFRMWNEEAEGTQHRQQNTEHGAHASTRTPRGRDLRIAFSTETYQVAVSFPITDSQSCPRYGGISRPRQYRSSAIVSTGSPTMTSSPGRRWRRRRWAVSDNGSPRIIIIVNQATFSSSSSSSSFPLCFFPLL